MKTKRTNQELYPDTLILTHPILDSHRLDEIKAMVGLTAIFNNAGGSRHNVVVPVLVDIQAITRADDKPIIESWAEYYRKNDQPFVVVDRGDGAIVIFKERKAY